MKKLFNQTDRSVLKEMIANSKEERTTLSFYQYAHIKNVQLFRDYLFLHWDELGVLGRTYVAREGINAQISVPTRNFDAFKEHLYSISFLDGVRLNIAVDDNGKSFFKLKIKIRDKIVADGLNDETFDVTDRGNHLDAKEFNELTDREDTILIDMRNHYEHEVGHFEGAVLPDVDTFREELPKVKEMFEDKKDKNIVMYCTGGIRCEKASAWLKHQGFENVHQLDGGIIEYTRRANLEGIKNKFRGKNFVFDDRRGERISEEIIAKCHQCGNPADTHTNCVNDACHLLFIQCDECKEKYEGCCSEECQEITHLPVEEQRALRKGLSNSNRIFRKGRSEKLKFKE